MNLTSANGRPSYTTTRPLKDVDLATMHLSIIIVNWNTRDLLSTCLYSIELNPPPATYELIVVDNASRDGSREMVQRCFPDITLLSNSSNPGFASANNQGIRHSTGRFILLLNPDTIVLPGAFAALMDTLAAAPETGAAGAMLLNPDGSIQVSSYPAPTLSREAWRLFHLDSLRPAAIYPPDHWERDDSFEVDTVQGACLLLRRDAVDQVGLLDETFFMYSEEVDLCYRLRLGGWSIRWTPAAQVVHFGGQSTRLVAADMFTQLYRAKLQYMRKHLGAVHGVGYKGILLAASAARIALTPLSLLADPQRRAEHLILAGRYGDLIRALPGL